MMPCGELKKILYVEDDGSIQLVTRLALEDVGGLGVKVCSSGQEAIEVATEFAPAFPPQRENISFGLGTPGEIVTTGLTPSGFVAGINYSNIIKIH